MEKNLMLVLLTIMNIIPSSFLLAQYITPKDGWIPFTTPFPDTTTNITHIGQIVLDPPAGHHGKIYVGVDGHLYFEDGTRARFFGTNVCFSACYPDYSTTDIIVEQIAKQGFNMVRFHHLDGALTSAPGSNSSRVLNHEVLDKFDYLFARLKEKGIYSAIDLYSIRRLKSGDNIPFYDSLNTSISRLKRVYMFYPPAYALFRDYPDSLLTHINPYTGIAYKDDPSLVFIDPVNEGTLIDHYFWEHWDDQGNDLYLPRFYKAELETLWNDWLYNKYQWDTTLIRAWSGDTGTGPNQIINGEFTDTTNGTPDFWFFNQFSGSATWGVEDAGLSTEPAVYVDVTSPGQYSWHIQLGQKSLLIYADSTYEIRFRAKSNISRSFDIVVQQDHNPWNVYYSTTINTTPSAQTFILPFYASISDSVQLTFNLGSEIGKVWIDTVELFRAPFGTILDPGESLATRTIKLITWHNRYLYSPYRIFDQIRFFYDKESKFYNLITSLLRDTLNVQALITSSHYWANELQQRAWAELTDVMDAHCYFDHPQFPNQPWDTLDFRIHNHYFGEGGYGESMFTGINSRSAAGKPMIITEWQHPAPNESRYVTLVPFAGYCRLRDYDAILTFAFAHSEESYWSDHIRPFFDSSGKPTHFILLRFASLAFLRDFSPEDLERTPWNQYDPELLLRDVYAGNYWQRAILSSPRDRVFNQFYWNSQKALFILNTKGTKAFTGQAKNDTAQLGGIKVVGGDDGAFVASRVESTTYYTTFLTAAISRFENSNMVWVDSTKTQGMLNWGNTPCLAESVSFYTYWNADSLQISKLNPNGEPISIISITDTNNVVPWLIRTGIDSVCWYEVRAYGYQDTNIYIAENNSNRPSFLNTYAFTKNGAIYFANLPAGAKLKVYNVLGQLILTRRINTALPILKVNSLASGIYFYRIINGSLQKKGKVVVIR